jgi:hypothetical protein
MDHHHKITTLALSNLHAQPSPRCSLAVFPLLLFPKIIFCYVLNCQESSSYRIATTVFYHKTIIIARGSVSLIV